MADWPLYDKNGAQIDPLTWGDYNANRDYSQIADSYFAGMRLSTVWLGVNHDFTGEKPVVFETMIFGGPFGARVLARYHTEEEAALGHYVLLGAWHDPVFLRLIVEPVIRGIKDGRTRHGWVKWVRDLRRYNMNRHTA